MMVIQNFGALCASARRNWFPVLCALILFVSLYDTLLIVVYQDEINVLEQNPVGLWLLQIADGEVGVFVRAKLAGTLVVLCALVSLRRYFDSLSFPITAAVGSFQTGLFTYLTFA